MHAVFTTVTINDEGSATARLRDEIVPQVSSAPGFIAGYWVRLPGGKGVSIVAFESEEAAQAMVNMLRDRPAVDDTVTLDSVEVGEVVASA
jgi:hypothetical protein